MSANLEQMNVTIFALERQKQDKPKFLLPLQTSPVSFMPVTCAQYDLHSSVWRTGRQRESCHLWCSLMNAKQTVQCCAVNTDPT